MTTFSILALEFPAIAYGLINTVWVCAVAGAISLLLALLMSAMLMSRRMLVRLPMRMLVDALRAIPFLMLLFIAYYCLPIAGLRFSNWTCGLVALVLYNAAYFAEILRGTWSHLSPAQEEAGRAFGMHGTQLYRRIILPQILIISAPVMGNQMIALIKNSSFLMFITIPELMFTANQLQSIYFKPFEMLFLAMLLYWSLCSVVEIAVRRMDQLALLRGNG